MTLVAGVDSSTQSCKVVVRDLESGAHVRSGRATHPDGTEVDPAFWWDALQSAIADAGGLDDVAAIAVAGQQHGMVVLDAAGQVIRPALLWNDTRSAQAALDLIAEVGADEYSRRTGLVPVASFTATKLRWLRDHEPEAGEVGIGVLAIPVRLPSRRRQDADRLVPADGRWRDPCALSQLRDLHARTLHLRVT